MYPKASGTGIMASSLMREILKMAGLHDCGLKLHGSRNVRNAGESRFAMAHVHLLLLLVLRECS